MDEKTIIEGKEKGKEKVEKLKEKVSNAAKKTADFFKNPENVTYVLLFATEIGFGLCAGKLIQKKVYNKGFADGKKINCSDDISDFRRKTNIFLANKYKKEMSCIGMLGRPAEKYHLKDLLPNGDYSGLITEDELVDNPELKYIELHW